MWNNHMNIWSTNRILGDTQKDQKDRHNNNNWAEPDCVKAAEAVNQDLVQPAGHDSQEVHKLPTQRKKHTGDPCLGSTFL